MPPRTQWSHNLHQLDPPGLYLRAGQAIASFAYVGILPCLVPTAFSDTNGILKQWQMRVAWEHGRGRAGKATTDHVRVLHLEPSTKLPKLSRMRSRQCIALPRACV